MRAFDLITARDAHHAAALLAEYGPAARLLAGGTDLLVDLKSAPAVPAVIVDISRAEDLKQIAIRDEGLSIGALVTHAEIMRSPLIRNLFPALVEAAHTIGAVQTRNLGTLGGNLVTGVPSMDSGPALVALEALVTLLGRADGARSRWPDSSSDPQDDPRRRRVDDGDPHPQGESRQARGLPQVRFAQGTGARARQRRGRQPD
jgi:CO/xanthine dehydrogenase FAD-binding subunit